MPSFFLALVAAALATLGGREAVRVARLSAVGRGTAVLVVGGIACAIASVAAARLGAAVAGGLAPEAKRMLIALALLLAAAEVLVLKPRRAPSEPTRSLGALLLVLVAGQLSAGAVPITFALAGSSGTAWTAAAGGALGSGAVLAAAWSMADEWETRLPLALLRPAVAAGLLAAAVATGLSARGLL